MSDPARPVPWRTILATIAAVVATLFALQLLRELARVLAWVMVAGFLAVVLGPAVDLLQRRLRVRRGLAAAAVFLLGLAAFSAMLYTFIRPIVGQVQTFLDQLPAYVEDARQGRGAIGELIQRYELDRLVAENQDRIQAALSNAGAPALSVVRSLFSTALALVTILVLSFLMLMRGPQLCAGFLALIGDPAARQRVRVVAGDAARAVSGYMLGNLLISILAGLATYAFLRAFGVPYAEVIALWVAFADLIPLVGATLGAVPTVALAFLHSTPAGIAAIVFFVAYQQFENHVLQVWIMSRTVDVNPLTVLLSVLAGVELFGFLGALLAIPVAGVIQVVARNVWNERQGRLTVAPTVTADEVPVEQVIDGGNGAGAARRPASADES